MIFYLSARMAVLTVGLGFLGGCGGGNGSRSGSGSAGGGNVTPNPGRIAFLTQMGEQSTIAITDDEGKSSKILYSGEIADAALSPDRQKLVFTRDDSDAISSPEIFLGDVEGEVAQKIVSGGASYNPKFSPDGKSIVYSHRASYRQEVDDGPAIYTLKLDSFKPVRLTPIRKVYNEQISPAYSPDGQTIAYMVREPTYYKIYLMDSTGKNPRRLTNKNGNETSPVFSPDGKSVAYAAQRNVPTNSNADIYEIDLGSRKEKRLTSDPLLDVSPFYNPAGTKIAYSSLNRSATVIMNRDGSNPTKIPISGSVTSWQ